MPRFILFFALLTSTFAHALTERTLPQNLAEPICRNPDLRQNDLWKLGLFDSGIQIQILKNVSEKQLHVLARKFARQVRHQGYSITSCDSNSTLVATYPAPIEFDADVRKLSKALQASCARSEIRFANAKGRKSILLNSGDAIPRQSGMLSVTCFPTDSDFGPVVWFSLPTGNGPHPQTPIPLNTDLANWVNQTRVSEGLNPLKELSDIDLSPLLQNDNIMHIRSQMNLLRERLARKNISLVSEDRVIAKDANEAAWLLWNSPRHRDSLLDQEVTKLLITQKEIKNSHQILFVILTAK